MARKRMIDPGIWESEDFSKLSTLAKLVFIGMFSNADDEGRGKAKAMFLKSKLFPYEERTRVADIETSLGEIAKHMSTTFYSHNGNEYYSLDNWDKWQRIDKPTPSKIPVYEKDSCNITRGILDEDSSNARRTLSPNRIEENRKRIEEEREENIVLGAETAPSPSNEHPLITLTLNDKNEYPIYQKQISEWEELYPAVNIMQELRNMKGWIHSNPKKRKTKSGILRFITGWLAREQDKGYKSQKPNPGSGNPFLDMLDDEEGESLF